jgi:predicted dehydrogenase/threonine dehydrogenase-like Zn-dependent dehydrogenase
MKQVLLRQGGVAVEEVPAPVVEAGTVLVRVHHSCISVGTEMSGLRTSAAPLWRRAIQQPRAVLKVVEMALTQGVGRTASQVRGVLTAGNPTGYSAAGTVVEVGSGIDDLQPGDRVACAGAQQAHHAEFIRVSRNLVAPMPEGLTFPQASTVTLGAIALQGVRRASPTLGETFVVLGLGLLGQLACQLLKANGCRVVGTDLDRSRIDLASSLGMDAGVYPEAGAAIDHVVRLTDGLGADGVVITASSPSDEVVSTAFQMCRRKGRVVLVGDVGLHLNRADFYAKELDFLISTSYGPGRYDRNYEERGLDYPPAYVRWTENRNMAEYLRLVGEGKVRLGPLIHATYPVEHAADAYSSLQAANGAAKPLMVLLSYPPGPEKPSRVVHNPLAPGRAGDRVRLALVGAGSFAKGMHLPNLQALPKLYGVAAVVSRSGHNAQATARQVGARYATTDYQAVLADPEIDAVLIATRHDLHARMTLEALRAGKHVLVEKPLCLSEAELEEVEAFFAQRNGTPGPVLLTGFNRRFSPHSRTVRELTRGRGNPMILNYRMNAGHIPLDHWVHGPEGGGRNVGEACHVYDLFGFLTDARVEGVAAVAVRPKTPGYYSPRDNFAATATFTDGSVATLTYTAMGSRDHPKEQMEVFCEGKAVVLDDYKKTTVRGAKAGGEMTHLPEKGHREELEAFARAVREGGEWPIPLWQQVQAMRMSFEVERLLVPAGQRG